MNHDKIQEIIRDKLPSKLATMIYCCECQTCNKKFFEESMLKVYDLMREGKWSFTSPLPWYLQAAIHWLRNRHHEIVVWVTVEGERQVLEYPRSTWESMFTEKGITSEEIEEWLAEKKLKGII